MFNASQETNELGVVTGVVGSFEISAAMLASAMAKAKAGQDPAGIQLGFDLEIAWDSLRESQRAQVVADVLKRWEAATDAAAAGASVVPEPVQAP